MERGSTKMIRHRQGGPVRNSDGGGDSSDDEDDAFSSLATKRKNKKAKKAATAGAKKPTASHTSITIKTEIVPSESIAATGVTTISDAGTSTIATCTASTTTAATAAAAAVERQLPLSTTSSMKRHHKEISDLRKAKMDALLMELEKEKRRAAAAAPPSSSAAAQHLHHHRTQHVPEKKGSFVAPGEESDTTNLFVGNLAPSISEEDLTELFRQFGTIVVFAQ